MSGIKGKTGKYKRTPKMRKNYSKAQKGTKKPWAGKYPRTLETRKKMSKAWKGNKCRFWKGGKSKTYLYKHICDLEWRIWRNKVFERDNWACQTCEARSKAGEPIYLHPHHIKGWTKYPKLRYEVDNGITLCRECHYLLHRKKRCFQRKKRK